MAARHRSGTLAAVDSLSQFVLGASVSAAALGRRTAVWKAALWGGVAGTLPDLDVFFDHGDALLNMVLHRGHSHALFWLTLAAPVLAALPALLHRQREHYARWCLAMWLALVTHPLLDAMTVYGTQLLMPFSNHPFGVGSMFIIDPLYTVPLLVGLAVGLARRQWRGLRWVQAGLVLSTAYLAWSFAAQQHVQSLVLRSVQPPVDPQALLATPSPFNTVLWRIVAMRPDGSYEEGFYSFFDGDRPIRLERFTPGPTPVPAELRALPPVQRLAAFTHGFYKVQAQDGQAFVTDLRMGQEPNYSFSFLVARQQGGHWEPLAATNHGSRGDARRGLQWVWQRMWGADLPPPR
jgi:inner membrane protein